jgi:hypothetical protein
MIYMPEEGSELKLLSGINKNIFSANMKQKVIKI